MIENNGTTPENTQDSTIAPIPAEYKGSVFKQIETLQAQVTYLQQELAVYRNQRDSYVEQYNNARKFIQDSINRDDWSETELAEPFWTELAELMDLEIKREVEVEVTVTFRGTISLPVGTDPEDFSDYDWETSLEHTYYASDLEVYEISARER